MTINKTKFDQYVDRLYKARIKRDKNGIKSTGKRIKPNEPQGIDVIRQCQEICVICNQKYSIKDHENFEIHHVDGDRANTDTKNLVLICHLHHKQIHNKANSEFRNWVNTHQNKIKEQKTQPDQFQIGTMSIFGYQNNKKTSRKSSKSTTLPKSKWPLGV